MLAHKLKVSPENLVAGAGSTELIRLVPWLIWVGDMPDSIGPTYSEYETACRLAGAGVIRQGYCGKEASAWI